MGKTRIPASPEDGAELLRKLQIAVARTRSILFETSGQDVARLIAPEVMADGLLNGALLRIDNRYPTWGTLNNILSLAHRDDQIVFGYGIYWHEDLPRQYTFPMYQGGDT